MTRMANAVRWGWRVLLVALLLAPVDAIAQPVHIMYGLVKGTNELIRFNAATPGTVEETIHLTGVLADETLRAIDFRPLTGQLYALGTDDTSQAPRVYQIDLDTRVATPRARTVPAENQPADWGMSFVNDAPRIVSTRGANMRVSPTSGGFVSFDTDLNAAVPPPPVIDGIASDRQFLTPTQTTLFAINRANNTLSLIGGINGQIGGQGGGIVTEVGPLGVTISDSPTSLDITTNGVLFAAMRPNNGSQSLYTINAQTGAASLVGVIGDGTVVLDGLAVVDPSLTLSPASSVFTMKQFWDFVMVANLYGRGVVSGTAFLDGGVDVTAALSSCIIPGTVAPHAATLRCPGIAGSIFTPGKHSVNISLLLTDGATIKAEVFWTVLASTEP